MHGLIWNRVKYSVTMQLTTVKSRMSLMFGLILGQRTRLSSVVVTAFVSLLTCISKDLISTGVGSSHHC